MRIASILLFGGVKSFRLPAIVFTVLVALATGQAASLDFVTNQTAVTSRSDFFGFVGMKFTVGSNPLTVTELGRFFADGNGQNHLIKLVRASDDVEVPGGFVTVSMAGGVANAYRYGTLPSPVVLAPSTSYYLVSEEAGSQDLWFDVDTSVAVRGVASCDGAAYIGSGFGWTVTGGAGHAFGPMNFKYSEGQTVIITSPSTGATPPAGSDLVIEASASHFSGSVVKVEFFAGTTKLGEDTTAPYSLTWSSVAAGNFQLQAVATDNQGLSVTSSVVSISTIACEVNVPFITGRTLGSLRNNFSGPVGMKITVGPERVMVTDLARIFVAGNSLTHTVKVVRVSDEVELPNGSVTIPASVGVDGEFVYVTLPTPIILSANTAYYVVSTESGGGDYWYDLNTTVTSEAIATVDNAAFRTFIWDVASTAGHTFGPVNFKFAPCGVTNSPPQVSISSPNNQAPFVAPATVTIDAAATDTDGTVTNVEFYADATKLGASTTAPYSIAWSNVAAGTYGLSTRATDNEGASSTSAVVNITVDAAPAQLSVTPGEVTFGTLTVGQSVNRTFVVSNLGGESLTGTASVGAPFAVVSGSPFNVAPGATGQVVVSFSPVAAGEFNGEAVFTSNGGDTTNVMTGAATAGNPGTTPLTLTTVGGGTVKPNLGGQSLVTARSYSMTAVPGPGNLFSNWSGTLSSTSAKLTFLMQPFMVLQANFVANPFLGAQGTYNGLFHPEEDLTIENSGFVTATVSSSGAYSGRLQSGALRSSFRGSFDLNGRATNTITRVGTTPLSVELQLDLVGGNTLTGRVVNASWSANITMDRAVFNARINPATNFAGKYTVILPSDTESPEAAPVGAGFGGVVVSTAGLVSLTGTLGDGTPVRQQVSLSRNGEWPIFVSLYGGKGILIGWATFTGGEGVTGEGLWIRQGQPGNKIYAAGFTNEVVLFGSFYVPPAAGVRVVNLSNANVVFSGGDLSEPFSNAVVLGTNNKIANTSSNKLTMTIVLPTGLFNGTVQIPGSTKTTTFKGVLLQSQDSGWGYLTGTNFNGTVYFGL